MEHNGAKSAGATLWTRRRFLRLAGATALALGAARTAGISASHGPVELLYAGSLVNLIEHYVAPDFQDQTGIRLEGEAQGSVALARLVRSGARSPDAIIVADPSVIDQIVTADSVPSYTLFASNAVVVASLKGSPYEAATHERVWYEALQEPGVRLGRTDPALDPLGYRTLFVLQLAEVFYGVNGLADRLLKPNQLYPEPELMAQLESGQINAAFAYRNMAIDHQVPLTELPAQIDLSDPQEADFYGQASYVDPDGQSFQGSPIAYAAGALKEAPHPDAAAIFMDYLASSRAAGVLKQGGLEVPAGYPQVVKTGDGSSS